MKFLMMILSLLCASPAMARTVLYGKSTVVVSIPYGKETLLRFDKQVRTVSSVSGFMVKPANAETPDYATLSIMPRMPNSDALIAVVMEDDVVLKVRLKTSVAEAKDLADPIVEFKEKDEPINAENEGVSTRATELDLMKSMIQDDFIGGFDRRELDRPIDTSQKGISAKLIRQYEGDALHGYVFKVTNQLEFSSVTLNLRLLRLGKPNLAILSQADSLILSGKAKGKNETLLRIVAKSSARYSDVRIPVGVRKQTNPEVKQ
ncbi:MAG: hypothetical protein AB7G93_04605 [Bdellovibrionales bacterium]